MFFFSFTLICLVLLSGGGVGLYRLLAAVPHRQKPLRPGGRLPDGHAEPELQHGLHGAVLPQRLHQPRGLQPHVPEVQGRSQAPLPAPPADPTGPLWSGTAQRDRPHVQPERESD